MRVDGRTSLLVETGALLLLVKLVTESSNELSYWKTIYKIIHNCTLHSFPVLHFACISSFVLLLYVSSAFTYSELTHVVDK